MQVTEHFSVEEFSQHAAHGYPSVPYPSEWVESRLRPLCKVLETIRASVGAPVTIVSGYRTRGYQQVVNPKVINSQHSEGRAADIDVAGKSPAELHALVLRLYQDGSIRIGGLGVYDRHVHVDVREGDKLARWDERSNQVGPATGVKPARGTTVASVGVLLAIPLGILLLMKLIRA